MPEPKTLRKVVMIVQVTNLCNSIQELIHWAERVSDLLTKDPEARYYIAETKDTGKIQYVICRNLTEHDRTVKTISHWKNGMNVMSTLAEYLTATKSERFATKPKWICDLEL